MLLNFTNAVFLAPLAGISNSIFRKLCKEHGADVVCTEMVSADGTVRANPKTLEYVSFSQSERPIGIQLFGADPHVLADAAMMLYDMVRPDFFDLNFGCPVKKVVRRNGGSALLKYPPLIGKIVHAVSNAVKIPVTAKIRAGWRNNSLNFLEVGKIIQDSGASAIAMHARTQEQGYLGKANWEWLAELKEALNIPVIGNGDVYTYNDALSMLKQTGCDSIMLARGAFGNPWLFSQIKAALKNEQILEPSLYEKTQTALVHLHLMIGQYGERKGVYEMRKHFAWYLKGIPNTADVKKAVFKEETHEGVKKIIEDFCACTQSNHEK